MQCIGERSTALTGAAIDDRLTKVASELKKRDAVLVRQKDSEVSFVSCSIHLGPNSFVFLGHGRLSVKSSGDGNSICFQLKFRWWIMLFLVCYLAPFQLSLFSLLGSGGSFRYVHFR